VRILVTNDDGVHAPGIEVLEAIARELSDDIWTVAPAEEQSGAGHSLTLTDPVRVRQLSERRYAVRGTPTDSVMMAIGIVMKDARPDLVLSGVNRGANLAEDVTYSGTVSAAMEGTLAGVRSIALSQTFGAEVGEYEPFECARVWGPKVLRALLGMPWTPGVLLNVNFPAVAPGEVRGVRVTEQGFHDYDRLIIKERRDMRGTPYYWFGLGPDAKVPGHETDLKAIRESHISVTPLHLDLTHYPSMAGLRDALANLR
jgi:5'-nucleotidase